ncbi:MAG: UvrD-helicase domain-containing protein [Deltaproteobacteria bacterium]|nr:UvrD-helicase domain-containing protein [Deltaproteobacteria bacterium]
MSANPMDQAARDRIREDTAHSLLVEAAAGTGKTYELVQRLVRVLASGVPVDRVVAVTFTRKAAGELKLRLRQALDEARQSSPDPAVRGHLDAALARLEEARVGTIHSFCAEVLRERPVEAGVDPAFRELDEAEARRVYDQAFARFIQDQLAAPTETLSRALSRPLYGDQLPLERLADAGWQLCEWRDYDAPWQEDYYDLPAHMDSLAERCMELADLSRVHAEPTDDLFKSLAPAREVTAWLERAELDGDRSLVELESRLFALARDVVPKKGDPQPREHGMFGPVSRRDVLQTRDKLVADIGACRRRADAQLAVRLAAELRGVVAAYEDKKRRLGALDFQDLLLKVRDLVRGDQRVRSFLQGRFTHIFVDEYQDTDPLQTEILLLLAADDPAESDWRKTRPRPGALFLVGDPKQSIYRFRRADVVLYQEVRSLLAARGVGVVHLEHSFRATAPIQAAVNAAFAPELRGDGPGQPGYVALVGGPEGPETQPSLLALPVPQPHGRYGVTAFAVSDGLPSAVGGFIQWLLEQSGWTVRDPEAPERRIPIQARHVAVLFKRFTAFKSDVTRPYVEDLERRSIPHLLLGSRAFKDKEEINALVAACQALEWPEDELSVLATLRGPLFALEDDLLFRYRSAHGHLHPFKAPPEALADDLAPVQAALQLLAEISGARNHVPIPRTVSRLLSETRAHANFALRPAGNQVLANLQRVEDMARGFELQGGLSFRGFAERLATEASRPRSNEAPAFEEDTDGVRMMTVHSAKGLEFPVVILADIAAPSRFDKPTRYVDTARRLAALELMGLAPKELNDHAEDEQALEAHESVRLAYVAATRARDLLVLPGVGEGPKGLSRSPDKPNWTAPLDKVIYPAPASFRKPAPAPGLPFGGETTVLGAPENPRRPVQAIKPGLHPPRAPDAPPVAWLDPRTLELEPPLNYGLRHERYLARGEPGVAEASVAAYTAWRDAGLVTRELGEAASVDLIRASEAVVGPEEPVPVQAVVLPRAAGRPQGRRFGTLVHAVLRDVDLAADVETIRAVAQMQGRLLGAPEDERAAAVAPVQAALQHDLLRRARASARCHREHPVVFETELGQRLDGSIDLAFEEPSGWVVVDFKTDADPEAHRAQHVIQVQWYAHALGALTGAEVIGVLLYV